jgi:hypothetical protein
MTAVPERARPDLPIVWNRRFQAWRYEVGHSCLALRSPKPEYSTNIDVQFHNVRLMLLAPTYESLSLREPTDAEQVFVNALAPGAETADLVVIGDETMAGLVCCDGGWWVDEDSKEYWEPPGIFTLPGS